MAASLVLASPRYRAGYVEALREGFRRGDDPEKTAEEIDRIDADFEGFVAEITDKTGYVKTLSGDFLRSPTGEKIAKVPYDVFWLVNGETLIGEASVRYELNDLLIKIGGHVGYGIRPGFQRQGFGKLILKLALDVLRNRGVERALVTCYDHNVGSTKIIEANGGVMENLIDDPRGGGKSRRYWIDFRCPAASAPAHSKDSVDGELSL